MRLGARKFFKDVQILKGGAAYLRLVKYKAGAVGRGALRSLQDGDSLLTSLDWLRPVPSYLISPKLMRDQLGSDLRPVKGAKFMLWLSFR